MTDFGDLSLRAGGLASAIPIDQVIDLASSSGDKLNVDGFLGMSQVTGLTSSLGSKLNVDGIIAKVQVHGLQNDLDGLGSQIQSVADALPDFGLFSLNSASYTDQQVNALLNVKQNLVTADDPVLIEAVD